MTPHFSLGEFLRSSEAEKRGIRNVPTEEHLRNLHQLAFAMEAVRAGAFAGAPITITSAYRNPELNRAVGGVATSDHAQGLAADFTVRGLSARAAAITLRDWLALSDMPFDQMILETSRGIVHFSIGQRYRKQVLTQPGGPGTPVYPGIR